MEHLQELIRFIARAHEHYQPWSQPNQVPIPPDITGIDSVAQAFGVLAQQWHTQWDTLRTDADKLLVIIGRARTIVEEALQEAITSMAGTLNEGVRITAAHVGAGPVALAALGPLYLAAGLKLAAKLRALAARVAARLQALVKELSAIGVLRRATTSGDISSIPGSVTALLVGEGHGGSAAGRGAAKAALSAVGTPYVWGGNTPGRGLDCSGLTRWAWGTQGVHIPRLAQHQTVGHPVPLNSLAAGDLLVWNGHVAMYVGEGKMVEAGNPVQVQPVRETNMGMRFLGAWRPDA